MRLPTRAIARPIAYVAGPFRSADPKQMAANILTAQAAVRMLAAEGAAPFAPHVAIGHGYGQISERHAFEINEAFLLISSAIYLLPGWQQSAGTQIEVTMAQKCGIPRLHDPSEVRQWLKHRR